MGSGLVGEMLWAAYVQCSVWVVVVARGHSCMRPGRVMGCFGCPLRQGLGMDGEARIRQRDPSHSEQEGRAGFV